MKQDVTRKQGRIEFIYEHFFFSFLLLFTSWILCPPSVPSRGIYFFQCTHTKHAYEFYTHSYTSLSLYINKIISPTRISRKRQKENIFFFDKKEKRKKEGKFITVSRIIKFNLVACFIKTFLLLLRFYYIIIKYVTKNFKNIKSVEFITDSV